MANELPVEVVESSGALSTTGLIEWSSADCQPAQLRVAGKICYTGTAEPVLEFTVGGKVTQIAPTLTAGPTVEPLADSPIASWQLAGGTDPASALRGTTNDIEVVGDVATGGTVFIGGDFNAIVDQNGLNSQPRTSLAAFDLVTGQPTPWTPNLQRNPDAAGNPRQAQVYALEVDEANNLIYVGGQFDTADGQPRQRIAIYDYVTGQLVGGDFGSINNRVDDLLLVGDTLYVVGFSTSQGRNRALAFDVSDINNPVLLPWNPDFGNVAGEAPSTIDVDSNGDIWIGGTFTTVNGGTVLQNYLVKVDPITGANIPIVDTPSAPVIDLEIGTTSTTGVETVYLGLGGGGGQLTALDTATGTYVWPTQEIKTDGNVQAVAVQDGDCCVGFGGHYDSSQDQVGETQPDPDRISQHDPVTGEWIAGSWQPQFGGAFLSGPRTIDAIEFGTDFAVIGGDFEGSGNVAGEGFSIYHGDPSCCERLAAGDGCWTFDFVCLPPEGADCLVDTAVSWCVLPDVGGGSAVISSGGFTVSDQ